LFSSLNEIFDLKAQGFYCLEKKDEEKKLFLPHNHNVKYVKMCLNKLFRVMVKAARAAVFEAENFNEIKS
jgi:hypothetical protein